MTNQEHPITPPPELIEDWIEIARPLPQRPPNPGEFATLAARWGADAELDACCEWLSQNVGRWEIPKELRDARRPKPPSLKEQALKALDDISIASFEQDAANIIRQALEALPE